MFKGIFNFNTQSQYGVDLIRIISGLIIITFGMEIVDAEKLNGYTEWATDVGIPFPYFMVYIGKLAEIVGGVCLILGLFTRLACIPLMMTMFVITFILLDGNPKTGSFYLLLIFAIYFFIGSGKFSIDHLLLKRRSKLSA